MPAELPAAWIAGLNVVGWLVIQLGLARAITRLPDRWFQPPRPRPANLRPNHGRPRDRLGIRQWKSWLPDGAAWFEGGFAKARLKSRQRPYLERFLRETWRGEICHWLAIALCPVFFLWNPWWGDLVNLAYALLANLPCILVQRHNRERLQHLLHRMTG